MKKCVICETELNGNKQKFCSNKCTQKYKYQNHKTKLNTNTYARQVEKSKSRKFKLIELRGNIGCEKCGYIKNISALDFHHKNSNEKSFQLDSRTLGNKSWNQILEEFDKCSILCANCHREEHYPDFLFENRNNYNKI
jgi:hypothetical protein